MIKEDTAIGVLFAAALSLGVVLISSIRTYAVDLSHILFGNVLGVSSLDLWLTGIIGVVILILILVFYRQFLVISFDPVLAATLRMRVGLFNNMLLVLLALTIVISIQTVGVGLVAAMLVTPAATAYLLVRRLPSMMVLSGLFGGVSSLVGLFASYHLNVASGAAIVLTTTLIFLVVFLLAPRKGLVWDLSRRYSN
jgi:manganese/iron transport system permease protein